MLKTKKVATKPCKLRVPILVYFLCQLSYMELQHNGVNNANTDVRWIPTNDLEFTAQYSNHCAIGLSCLCVASNLIYANVHVCVCVCVHACMRVCVCACVRACMHVCLRA